MAIFEMGKILSFYIFSGWIHILRGTLPGMLFFFLTAQNT